MQLRDYQLDPHKSLVNHLKTNSRALCVMATGLGKSHVAAHLVKQDLLRKGRGLFLADDINILEQNLKVFRQILGETVSLGIFNGTKKDLDCVDVLFATFQTFNKWKNAFFADEFAYVLVDEAHHGAASTFRAVLDYFTPSYLLGLTATPERADQRDIREIFGDIVVDIPLEQGIAKNWLTPVEYHLLSDHINGRVVNVMLKELRDGGEKVSVKQLNEILFIERRDEEIARIVYSYGTRGIIFCENVTHAETLATQFAGAQTMHSRKSPTENAKVLQDFKNRTIPFLLVVDMLNEGIDIPDVELIVFLRSTDSQTIFFQQLGRGLRKIPGKEKVVVLDFVGNCDRVAIVQQLVERIQDYTEQGTAEYDHGPFFVKGDGFVFVFDDVLKQLEEVLSLIRRKRFLSEMPELVKEFNVARNDPLTPETLSSASKESVWWKCSVCEHEWQTSVLHRFYSHTGCPACVNQAVSPKNCMATTHPELAKEFHPELNAPLTSEMVVAGTQKQLWWKCGTCEHLWRAGGADRVIGNGCPACSNKVVTPQNCMATTHPELAKEFHPTKNAPLTSETVVVGTNTRLWWKCGTCEHEWQAAGSRRKIGVGCPACDNRVATPKNCLAVTEPELAKQFHPTKNAPLTIFNVVAGGYRILWWKCSECQFEWQMKCGQRLRSRNCPSCSNQVVTSMNCLATTHPKLAKEFHKEKNAPLTAQTVCAGTAEKLWWKCKKCQYEWSARGYSRQNGTGCPACANQVVTEANCLAAKAPHLASEFHPSRNAPLTPKTVTAGTKKKLWWKCIKCEYEWQAPGSERMSGRGCPACAGKVATSSNCLLATHPDLAKEFHSTKNAPLTTKTVVAGTNKKLWWKCSTCKHEWCVSGGNRTSGTGCPVCANQKVNERNCLATTHPNLAAEFHPTKNAPLTTQTVVVGTAVKLWWKCKKCEHEWQNPGYNRLKGQGCPACANKVVTVRNCLAATHPNLALEFHPTKNDPLTSSQVVAGTNKKLWWKCSTCQNEWQAVCSSRASGSGCPECAKEKRKLTRLSK
jgi:superfamily II DNA or RNA helicase